MIYLIESGEYAKIGYTTNLNQRYMQYSTDNPNFSILDYAKGTRLNEKILQSKYKKFALGNSEWCINKALVFKIWKEYVKSINDIAEESDYKDMIQSYSSHMPDLVKLANNCTDNELKEMRLNPDFIDFITAE